MRCRKLRRHLTLKTIVKVMARRPNVRGTLTPQPNGLRGHALPEGHHPPGAWPAAGRLHQRLRLARLRALPPCPPAPTCRVAQRQSTDQRSMQRARSFCFVTGGLCVRACTYPFPAQTGAPRHVVREGGADRVPAGVLALQVRAPAGPRGALAPDARPLAVPARPTPSACPGSMWRRAAAPTGRRTSC
jgi:hypothetical protein